MAEASAISWTDDTFNPWIGCARVGPACDGCYAAALMGGEGGRFHVADWGGPGKGAGTRHRTAPANWTKPRKWDREVAAEPAAWPAGRFVFCASLADWADNEVPIQWLADLLALIAETPRLTWLLLTKRIGIVEKRARQAMALAGLAAWPKNAAIGATVVTQAEADRDIPTLLAAKAALRPAFVFLSMEPLLEAVDIAWAISRNVLDIAAGFLQRGHFSPGLETLGRVDWVIVGGETDQGDHEARPADPVWMRGLRDQCAAAGVPFHFKQWGSWDADALRYTDMQGRRPPPNMKIGAKRAGRLLDGVTHDARPMMVGAA